MSQSQLKPMPVTEHEASWFQPPRLGWGDAVALLVWTVAVCWVFWDAVSLRGAFFYFDVSEINYPYRYFFAEELKAGRFSRWCPWLYCGLPLFSESQAGYLHPFKYLFYPWMETWKAFQLRHGVLDLAGRRGDVRLAPTARRAGRRAHRRGACSGSAASPGRTWSTPA